MKWTPSVFECDKVILNITDIVKLLLGKTIQDGACIISMSKKQKDANNVKN